ncbi:MAG: hypothetical protein AAF648_08655 [Pseudomonadota bacterium]
MTRNSSPVSKPRRWGLIPQLLCAWFMAAPALAEVLNANTPMIRLRWGDNVRGSVNTIVYEPGVPTELGALPGVTTDPVAVSGTAVSGGSGSFRVRIVTDLNARNGLATLTGQFSYDSSQPLQCTTPASCGATTISFQRISWGVRDSDTHTAVTRFDGSANQITQVQQDNDPSNRALETRHRNYFEYRFDNLELLPAGTYEGTTTLIGEASP